MLVPVNYSISLLPFSLNTIDYEKIKALIDKKSRDFLSVSTQHQLIESCLGAERHSEVRSRCQDICLPEPGLLGQDHHHAHATESE